ncbi:helix-turn-helix DNA binding domain protein [Streptomyces phage TurkishDelight]|uniref:Helix-turn-helix DNA binding domain protein n=1 Tax=Streptomyces phage TurkishDelight TaxID=2793708 RepID=A0A7T0Q3C1_9CAUD|nr:helix-turn-helix DNA binding domain protein [Streptomyces phage TurkishDelight]QPL14030.1 helix-turn-helix DNA binding domain protein [Streptomyces phage TurkishDelight]
MGASRAQRAAAARKRAEATQLRIAGVDWATIADRVGYASAGAACTAVGEALKANLREQDQNVEELRALGVAKVNRLQAAFWTEAVVKKDIKAAKIVLECIKQEARFQGTEAPTRVNLEAQRLGDEILAALAGDDGDAGELT